MISRPPVPVGGTSLHVSSLGLGTAPLCGFTTPVSEAQSVATVHAALAQGITLIDTAPLYARGESERRLGVALAGVPRQSYVLSTKVGRLLSPDGTMVFDYTPDGIRRSLEESLRRLRLDHVDILLVHDPDDNYQIALDQAFPTLADLRDQGVIGAIGAGMNQWQMLADFARHTNVDCFLLAGRYTLLEQGALDVLLPLCQERNIGLFLGGVFNSGILVTGPRAGATYNYTDAPPEVVERVRRLDAVCARHGIPLATAALQFPLAHPAVTSLVVGAQSPAEVTANVEALRTPIPPGLWAELRHEGLLQEAAPLPA